MGVDTVRYLNIRVLLAQLRLSTIYDVPAVSIFWPTDPISKLPTTDQQQHTEMAKFVDLLIKNSNDLTNINGHPVVSTLFEKMKKVAINKLLEYKQNPSVRAILKDGFSTAKIGHSISIDPPTKVNLLPTSVFLTQLEKQYQKRNKKWLVVRERLESRNYTIIFTGTANKMKSDSEHPWPGYLSLIDILYARANKGKSAEDREMNLIYQLPVPISIALRRLNSVKKIPTATYIVDCFADLLVYAGGIIAGRPVRGKENAIVLLGE